MTTTTLGELWPMKITITHENSAVTILQNQFLIDQFVRKNPDTKLEWREEYSAYASCDSGSYAINECAIGNYASILVECEA